MTDSNGHEMTNLDYFTAGSLNIVPDSMYSAGTNYFTNTNAATDSRFAKILVRDTTRNSGANFFAGYLYTKAETPVWGKGWKWIKLDSLNGGDGPSCELADNIAICIKYDNGSDNLQVILIDIYSK